MPVTTIIQILDLHSVEHFTDHGRIYACEHATQLLPCGERIPETELVDVTDFSRIELLHWLGY